MVHEGFLEDLAEPAADDTVKLENPDNDMPVPPWRQAGAVADPNSVDLTTKEIHEAVMSGHVPASSSEPAAELEAADASAPSALQAEQRPSAE